MTNKLEGLSSRIELKDSLPFKCSISMGPYSVAIFSEVSDFLPFFQGEGEEYIPWIPGWKVELQPSPAEHSIIYIPEDSSIFDFDQEAKTLTVRGPIEEFQDGQALAYLGFWLTEAQRQNEGIVTAHASALSTSDKGVLIFGERGEGKTSVALAMGRRFGYKLVANDLAMVGLDQRKQQLKVHDGTKIFGLRLSAIRGRFPELLYLFSHPDQLSWITKAFVYPEEVGMETDNESRHADKAFMVHLDSTKTDRLTHFRMDDLWIRNYLYENFSRYLRATAVVAFGAQSGDFLDFMPSLDTRELHENRLRLINHLIEDVGVINVSGGSLEEISDFIHQEVRG